MATNNSGDGKRRLRKRSHDGGPREQEPVKISKRRNSAEAGPSTSSPVIDLTMEGSSSASPCILTYRPSDPIQTRSIQSPHSVTSIRFLRDNIPFDQLIEPSSTSTNSNTTSSTDTTLPDRITTDDIIVVESDSDDNDEDDVVLIREDHSFDSSQLDDLMLPRHFRSIVNAAHHHLMNETFGTRPSDREGPFFNETERRRFIEHQHHHRIHGLHPMLIINAVIGGTGGVPLFGGTMGSYEDLLDIAERLGPGRPVGMTQEDINSLPVKPHSVNESDPTKLNCVICMSDYEEGEMKKGLPCSHEYHVKCIDPWLKERKSCPICRDDIVT